MMIVFEMMRTRQSDLNPGVVGSGQVAVTSIPRGSSPYEDDDDDHSEMVPTTVMMNEFKEEGDASPSISSIRCWEQELRQQQQVFSTDTDDL